MRHAVRRAPFVAGLGQSMLEAVVAIGIITTALSSALTLVSGSINAEKDSETRIVAGNLAREGVEVVRSMRDSNWLAGAAWDAGLSGAANDYTGALVFSPASNAWSINFTPNAVTASAARVFRFTTGSGAAIVGLHVQAASQPAGTVVTPFRRLLILDPLCDDGAGGYTIVSSGSSCGAMEKIGIRVTSKVRWTVGSKISTLDIEERMFNWR
jgi:type II secretory pathway pseudopilin PulG